MPYFLYLQKVTMDKSKCGLEWCSEPIPPGRHGNAGGCCPEHSALIKALKEKARYQEKAQAACRNIWLQQRYKNWRPEPGFTKLEHFNRIVPKRRKNRYSGWLYWIHYQRRFYN